jgi:hypothetical protein
VDRFPIIGRHHFDRVPGAAVKKRAVGSFANAFLAANAEIRINFNASERRMIFVRYPKHASFDRTVFNASGGSRATGATVGSDRKNSWTLLARRFAITL